MRAYLDLIRFSKPVGTMLLVLPCFMGLALQNASWGWYVAFLCGAFFMRSFGCIINDIFDKNLDKHVERTKNRPLANGALNVKHALLAACVMACFGFVVFLLLPIHSKIFSIIGVVLAVIYPLMKRITHWPQAFLGLTFNMGALVTCFDLKSIYAHIILYISCCFWTIAYDSIYGFQDILDDQKIGIKSTSQKFQHHPKCYVGLFYGLFFAGILGLGTHVNAPVWFYGALAFNAIFTCLCLYKWIPAVPQSNGTFFKYNQIIGMNIVLIFLIFL